MKLPFSTIAEHYKISAPMLAYAAAHWTDTDSLYRRWAIPTKWGRKRPISEPCEELKALQREICGHILSTIPAHEACHSSGFGRSIVTNAAAHVGKAIVVKIHLKDYYSAVTAERISGRLSFLLGNYLAGHDIQLITRVCTYKGVLPQGAPTSPALADLVCYRLDARLATIAGELNAAYTRHADNLTFSGSTVLVKSVRLIRRSIMAYGFKVSSDIQIIGQRSRQKVTGLTVNKVCALPRNKRKWLRAIMHRIATGREVSVTPEELRGHLASLRSVDPTLAEEYFKIYKQKY